MKEKMINVLFKPYSEDVKAYRFQHEDCGCYFVVNSNLTTAEQDAAYSKLLKLSANCSHYPFILLQGNGEVYKSENLKLPEMRVAE